MKLENVGRLLFAAYLAWMLMMPWTSAAAPTTVVQAAAPGCPAPHDAAAAPQPARTSKHALMRPVVDVLGTADCPADLIAYWEFEDTSIPPVTDSAGDHDATCAAGKCPTSTTGVVGNAHVFNSTTEVTVTAHADFNWGLNDSFSIEYWMKTDSASTCAGNQVILGRDVTSGPDTELHWWAGCLAGGKAAFYARDLDGNLFSVASTTDVTDGDWHHIVAARDADTDELRLYVDGVLEGTTPAAYTAGFNTAATALNLGWLKAGVIYHYQGAIDELAVYGRALAVDEVNEHMDANLDGYGICEVPDPVEPDPILLYLPLIFR